MYVYAADVWCDSCGADLARSVPKDSDDCPSGGHPAEPTDSPQHCGAGAECLEAVDLGLHPGAELIGAEARKVGALLGSDLTEEGVGYMLDMITERPATAYQRALHRLWADHFAQHVPDSDSIIDDVAWTLHMLAYADACEDGTLPGMPTAGPGEDWTDVTPTTVSKLARELAEKVRADVEGRADVPLWALSREYVGYAGDTERFGHGLAMMALGHGVAPSDDVPPGCAYRDPKVGSFELHYGGPEDLA